MSILISFVISQVILSIIFFQRHAVLTLSEVGLTLSLLAAVFLFPFLHHLGFSTPTSYGPRSFPFIVCYIINALIIQVILMYYFRPQNPQAPIQCRSHFD